MELTVNEIILEKNEDGTYKIETPFDVYNSDGTFEKTYCLRIYNASLTDEQIENINKSDKFRIEIKDGNTVEIVYQ